MTAKPTLCIINNRVVLSLIFHVPFGVFVVPSLLKPTLNVYSLGPLLILAVE